MVNSSNNQFSARAFETDFKQIDEAVEGQLLLSRTQRKSLVDATDRLCSMKLPTNSVAINKKINQNLIKLKLLLQKYDLQDDIRSSLTTRISAHFKKAKIRKVMAALKELATPIFEAAKAERKPPRKLSSEEAQQQRAEYARANSPNSANFRSQPKQETSHKQEASHTQKTDSSHVEFLGRIQILREDINQAFRDFPSLFQKDKPKAQLLIYSIENLIDHIENYMKQLPDNDQKKEINAYLTQKKVQVKDANSLFATSSSMKSETVSNQNQEKTEEQYKFLKERISEGLLTSMAYIQDQLNELETLIEKLPPSKQAEARAFLQEARTRSKPAAPAREKVITKEERTKARTFFELPEGFTQEQLRNKRIQFLRSPNSDKVKINESYNILKS